MIKMQGKNKSRAAVAAVFVLLAATTEAAFPYGQSLSYNGLSNTPAMGFDTYNSYAYAYNQSVLMSNAQRMVDWGFRDLGYKVIILDDAWSTFRDKSGKVQVNMTMFPQGMKAVGDQFHDMGLQLGMYSSAGRFTCGGWPGSLGQETNDAESFASWGADYLKYDNCYNEGESGTPQISYKRYKTMSDALNATGRPMVYSLCNWGDDKPWEWGTTISNSWRMSGDIFDSFNLPTVSCPCSGEEYYCQLPGFKCSVMNILNKAAHYASKAQPGGWNDLDMLEVGNGGMSYDEYKVHFSMWAAMKSPLIMGNNLELLSPADYAILVNPAVLAISQDPAGQSATRAWRYLVDPDDNGQGEISLWTGSLANGDQVVALLNAANSSRVMNATLVDIFGGVPTASQAKQAWQVYDLWGNTTLMNDETANGIMNGTIGPDEAKGYYNATQTPFAVGLERGDDVLFGTKVGEVQPMGTWSAMIQRHGIGFYRFRPSAASGMKRDEL